MSSVATECRCLLIAPADATLDEAFGQVLGEADGLSTRREAVPLAFKATAVVVQLLRGQCGVGVDRIRPERLAE